MRTAFEHGSLGLDGRNLQSCSDRGSPETNSGNCSLPVVYVVDHSAERRGIVFQIVGNGVVVPQILEPQSCAVRQGGITLVALPDNLQTDDWMLPLVSRLKRCGQTVIAYSDGISTWSITTKCRPFLAGASKLIDSSNDRFKVELQSALAGALFQAAGAKHHAEQIQVLMQNHGIIGKSAALTDAFSTAIRFSELGDLPVLITGQTGTGKELIARAIAAMDRQHNTGPFVAVNCSAIPPTMLEGEFFGHRRGAFTGAERDRKGWIRSADGGVLFLDEIGEMDLTLQAKLLRVLQDRRVRGVGEDQDVAVTTRFLAATNRDLGDAVRHGKFRADLLNRLEALTVELPSLALRHGDVGLLINHFIAKQEGLQPHTIGGATDEFISAVEELDLTGNVRQLENIIRRCILSRSEPGKLALSDLPFEALSRLVARPEENEACNAKEEVPPKVHEFGQEIIRRHGWKLHIILQECEKAVCVEALKLTHGNQSEAAKLLGVTPRCVYNKVHKFRM